MPLSTERKAEYFTKLKTYLNDYNKAFVVAVDNVGSKQIQMTRQALRGKAEILMGKRKTARAVHPGRYKATNPFEACDKTDPYTLPCPPPKFLGKNTMVRKCLREYVEENPGSPVGQLVDICVGNVGFVFTNGDLGAIRTVLESNTRPAPARVGAIAPTKVIVPKGPTGCDPGQTAFFQTLQIATKITKGQIEMVNDTELIEAGRKVTASEAALLQKLNIEPFTYGMVLRSVYDNGSLFDAKVLDITDAVLAGKFAEALNVVASLSLAMGYPTQASVPHSIVNAYKAILSITLICENYSFKQADEVEEYLKDPSKFAGSGGGGGGDAGGGAAAVEVKAEEEEEEAEIAGGVDMFGAGKEGGGDY
jgi:large subunit ribosomal protein LP0